MDEPWYLEADMSSYLAHIIHNINSDVSTSDGISSALKIRDFLDNLRREAAITVTRSLYFNWSILCL